MPSYTPLTTFNWLKVMVKGMKIDDIMPLILDDANKLLWTSAPWRWTLGVIDAATIPTNPAGDVALGTLPADFLYAYKAWTVSTADSGTPRELLVVAGLSDDVSVKGQASQVQIIGDAGSAGSARLFPQPTNVPAGTKLYIIYKKTAPTITKENQGDPGVLVMPDEYVPVYNMGCLYYAYLYADDQRAGSASTQDNRVSYSGILGTFKAFINDMKMQEKLPLADDRPPDRKMERG